jgi:hypothetical protein
MSKYYHLTAYPYYLPFITFFKKSPQMFGMCTEPVYICYVIERKPIKTIKYEKFN